MRSEITELQEGTGSVVRDVRDVQYQFDKYVVTVRLTPTNEFRGIVGVAVSRDFRSPRQRIPEGQAVDAARFNEEE